MGSAASEARYTLCLIQIAVGLGLTCRYALNENEDESQEKIEYLRVGFGE